MNYAHLLKVKAAAELELRRRRKAIGLTDFKRALYRRYEHAPHLEQIDAVLTAVEAGELMRVIIAAPPRHGKSLTVSRLFPAWYLGRNPHNRIILVSYGASLAEKHSRAVRNMVNSRAYANLFRGVTLAADSKAADAWDIAGHEGGMDALGVGGAVTGKGANCFPAETLITTELGQIPIGELCAMTTKPRVLAYSHRERRVYWATIEAQRVVYSRELVEIKTTGGKCIYATPEHLIYVNNKGYIAAERLKSGDTLKTISESQPNMHLLRRGVRKICLSASESSAAKLQRHVLFNRVQPSASRNKALPSMQAMRQTVGGKKRTSVLFAGMPSPFAPAEANTPMPTVQQRIHAKKLKASILLKGLRQQNAFKANDRRRESSFQNRHELRQMVRRNEVTRSSAGLPLLRSVPYRRTIYSNRMEGQGYTAQQSCDSSSRRKPKKQRCQQFGDALQDVSRCSPQIESDTVSVVARICGECQPVYDIQVGGFNNFFAGKILVHNCLIIDDPLKSRAEAESKLMRDKIWDAYTDDLYTRLQPGGAVIVMATRWHSDDLTGRLLRNSGENWHVLTLPAIDEHGAALWPERYPVDVLDDIRRTLGEYSWASLYQQRPMPAEGGLFKRAWLEPRGIVPAIKYAVRYWDLAMSTKTQADYTVGCKVGVGDDNHLYVLDVHRERIEWPDLATRLADIMIGDGPDVVQGVEEQGYMSRAVQDLNADSRLRGYAVFGYKVDKDKFTRALRPAAKAGAGLLHTVSAHWTDAFVEELCAFPNAEHDDQVDALSGAIAMLESDITGQGQISYGAYVGIEGTY